MIRFFNVFIALVSSLTLFGEASFYSVSHLDKKFFAEDIEIDFSEQGNTDEDSSLVKLEKGNFRSADEFVWNTQEAFSKSVASLSVKSNNSLYLLYCNLKLDC